jgi:ketosteroid isomerase-like protein
MRKNKTVGIVCAVTLLAALVGAPALAGDDSNIAERIVTWEKAFNAGDAKALAAHYTEDAARLVYQAPAISGRAAIMENIQATYELGLTKIDLEVLGSESQGNLAWAHGTYKLMTADGAIAQEGKWMNVSKKVKGAWMTQADIWNTNAPDAP